MKEILFPIAYLFNSSIWPVVNVGKMMVPQFYHSLNIMDPLLNACILHKTGITSSIKSAIGAEKYFGLSDLKTQFIPIALSIFKGTFLPQIRMFDSKPTALRL